MMNIVKYDGILKISDSIEKIFDSNSLNKRFFKKVDSNIEMTSREDCDELCGEYSPNTSRFQEKFRVSKSFVLLSRLF
jgi:hypothetical protein